METEMMRIKDAYPDCFEGDCIFTDLQNLNVPWKNDDIATYLDVLYSNHSSRKYVSEIVRVHYIDGLSNIARAVIASSIFSVFNIKWTKLYNVLSMEYNPISNYDMVENESISDEGENSQSSTNSRRETGTRENRDTGTVSNSGSNDVEMKTFGFNSISAVDSDATDSDISNTETRNLTFTETPNITIADTESGTASSSNERVRELTRSGNIGVTTSQQLLESEIALWQWLYFEEIFNDIDSILCLKIY